MSSELRRFVSSVPQRPDAIAAVLNGRSVETERPPGSPPLEAFYAAITQLGAATGPAIDQGLVEPLHRALPMSQRVAADPRVWQWLALKGCPELVWRRWWRASPPPSDWGDTFTVDRAARFGCSATLNGVSRNTFARLWWVAEAFDGDYDRARRAIANQDLFQAIFERGYGLYKPAARACLAELEGEGEKPVRDAVKWLQFCLGTATLQALDEAAIRVILREGLQASKVAQLGARGVGTTTPVGGGGRGKASSGGGPRASAVRAADGSQIDAHFRIEADGPTLELRYESSGGRSGGPNPRNLDYRDGMNILLARLAGLGAILEEVLVDSEPMRKKPRVERRVHFERGRLPLVLADVTDIDALRSSIMTRARKVGQDADRRAQGGGSSRALCLVLSGVSGTASGIQEALALGPAG